MDRITVQDTNKKQNIDLDRSRITNIHNCLHSYDCTQCYHKRLYKMSQSLIVYKIQNKAYTVSFSGLVVLENHPTLLILMVPY